MLAISAASLTAKDLEIDAVTAATVNHECKFVSIAPTTMTAKIIWTETHADKGSAKIYYDTVSPPVVSRAVTTAERAETTLTLVGLKPSKHYYIQLDVREQLSTANWYQATGEFTTQNGTTPIQQGPFTSGMHPSITRSSQRYLITDLRGSLVAHVPYPACKNLIQVPGLPKGVYHLSSVDNSVPVDNYVKIRE